MPTIEPQPDAGGWISGPSGVTHPAWCALAHCTVRIGPPHGETGCHLSEPIVTVRPEGGARTNVFIEKDVRSPYGLIFIEVFHDADPDEPETMVCFRFDEARVIHGHLALVLAAVAE